jgi:hypothetical protein
LQINDQKRECKRKERQTAYENKFVEEKQKGNRKENIEKGKQSEGSRIGVTKKRRVGLLLTASYETHRRGNSLGVVLQNMYFYTFKTQKEV